MSNHTVFLFAANWNDSRTFLISWEKAGKRGLRMRDTAIPLKEKLLTGTVLTVTGSREVCVENYRFLRLLTEQEVQIQARDCRISIVGKKLTVIYYTRELMKIRGWIQCIQYQTGP